MSYYNTTIMTGQQLTDCLAQTSKQEDRIELIFKSGETLTPSEAHKRYNTWWNEVPITSVRRAITDLTSRGVLEKTTDKKAGIYGKPEYVWKYSKL